MNRRRAVAIAALLWAGLVGLAVTAPDSPAAADCSGPSIAVAATKVDRGVPFEVTGSAWGDNCYDAGTPPDAEGFLGHPVPGIEIRLQQGDREIVLAAADADEQYEFTVEVVIPADVEPGEVMIYAKAPHALPYGPIESYNRLPIQVSTAAPVTPPSTTTTSTRPAPTTSPSPTTARPAPTKAAGSDDGTDRAGLMVLGLAAVVVLAVAVGAMVMVSARNRRR